MTTLIPKYDVKNGGSTPAGAINRAINLKLAEFVSVKDFGATGDGTTDDSAAIAAAILATPVNGTLYFPNGTYIVDYEFKITQPMTLMGNGGVIKLKNQSNLFNDYTNGYGRYIFHIRSSNVTFENLYFNGNSVNNYKVVGSENHYYYAIGGTWQVSLVMVGWYGSGVTVTSDLTNININNCTFYDSPFNSVDWLMQGQDNTGYAVVGARVTNNYFELGQGGQCPPSNTRNLLVANNTFKNAYFCAFQWYIWNVGGRFDGNSVYFNLAEIDLTKVDPALKALNYNSSATILIYGGYIQMGKADASPNLSCDVTNNTVNGTEIYFTAGMTYSTCGWNTIYKSQQCGIEYSNTLAGNKLIGNKIIQSNSPGLMLEASPATEVVVFDNQLLGCCTEVVSPLFPNQSSGYRYSAQIYIANEAYYFKNNYAKTLSSLPSYGVLLQSNEVNPMEFSNNYFVGSGSVVDVATALSVTSSAIPTVKTVSNIGDLQQWSYSMNGFPAGGTLDNFPIGKNGFVLVSLGIESAYYVINSASGATTCTKVSGTANTIATNSGVNLRLFQNGANSLELINGLATAQPLNLQYFFR